jgi:DNA-binding XRE family transcriptional regulator/tetratricopeptide (TPR) repeat protein
MASIQRGTRRGLAKRRKALGFTQEALAEHLRVERSTVVRWEAGKSEPQAWLWPRLSAVLRITSEQLTELLAEGAADTLPEVPSVNTHQADEVLALTVGVGVGLSRSTYQEVDDMQRRALLRLLAIAGGSLAISGEVDWRRVERASQTNRFDKTTVDQYAVVNSQLWQVFTSTPRKSAALPLVQSQLRTLINGLQEANGSIVRKRLSALVADTFQLAGEIAFDANRYTDAAHCYTMAATASKEANDFDLWASAMIRHSFVEVYERQFGKALPMLDIASKLANKGNRELSTWYWASTVKAQALAGLGDLNGFQREIGLAEGVNQLNASSNNGGWLRFDGSRIPEERGSCYTALNRPKLAEKFLHEALNRRLSSRRQGCVLTDLAMGGVQQGDFERVASYANRALDLAEVTHSGVIIQRLRNLQTSLAPLSNEQRISRVSARISNLSTVLST